jgi:regulator of RNase E activity RraA
MTTADLLDRLRRIDTTSLVDAGPDVRVLPFELRPVRPGARMVGRAVTADAQGDLMAVLAGLAAAGPGDVLVVAAGSDAHAVAGELFATEALRRGLAGIVIDGRCRDSATLATLDLPVFARGVAPSAFRARAVPVVQVPVMIGLVAVSPGDLVVGDDDGVVVAAEEEIAAVIDAAEAIQAREGRLRAAIAAGGSLFDALNVDEHVAALAAGRESRLVFRELP